MSQSSVGPARSELIVTEIDGDIALYDPQLETVAVLNGTASDIWRLCDGTQTRGEIIDTLAAAYGADRSVVAADVDRTLDKLRAEGWLGA